MKLLIGAALAAILVASPAFAQTATPPPVVPDPPAVAQPTACAPLPEQPGSPPDGATANRAQMEAASAAFTAWGDAYRLGIACRRQEVAQLTATHSARLAEHNQAASNLNAAIAAFQAEATEFNTLHPPRRQPTVRRSSN